MALLLGYDVGSSSIKATLLDAETGSVIASAVSPEKELRIVAEKAGWAEQRPEVWWQHVRLATQQIKTQAPGKIRDVRAIGISYQMHGLVLVDEKHEVLRPAIIWCDSRAVEIGEEAAGSIGAERCLRSLLNLPGNFTASKLKWVKDNEPDVYVRIHKIMLPGDYIGMRMTGEIVTTPSGLSEAIMWDFRRGGLADLILEHYGFSEELFPEIRPTFGVHGRLSRDAADELGLPVAAEVTYRAGDQPNNAFSLNVLQPGEIAATAGTSGVVYGITDKPVYDHYSRVNTFVHVNHRAESPRYGVLLCLNGAGILNSWLKHNFSAAEANSLSYEQINILASAAPVGCGGLVILPYGNGAERTLLNRNTGASVHGWNFNVHRKAHLLRAAQEGIVFALNYGLEIMRDMGIRLHTVRAGYANMFLSPLFSEAFAAVSNTTVELYNTDGSQGAARAAGIGAGIYATTGEAFAGLRPVKTIKPDNKLKDAYQQAYRNWKRVLDAELQKER